MRYEGDIKNTYQSQIGSVYSEDRERHDRETAVMDKHFCICQWAPHTITSHMNVRQISWRKIGDCDLVAFELLSSSKYQNDSENWNNFISTAIVSFSVNNSSVYVLGDPIFKKTFGNLEVTLLKNWKQLLNLCWHFFLLEFI